MPLRKPLSLAAAHREGAGGHEKVDKGDASGRVKASEADANIEPEDEESSFGAAESDSDYGEPFAQFLAEGDDFPLEAAIQNYFVCAGGASKKSKANEDDDVDDVEGDDVHIDCDMAALTKWLQVADDFIPGKVNSVDVPFDRWMAYLRAGFNLLIYGVGSKLALLNDFCTKKLSQFTHVTLNGFFSSVSVRSVLECVESACSMDCHPSRGTPLEWAAAVAEELVRCSRDVIIVINNIDGPGFGDRSQLCALTKLAECPLVRIVASFDDFNAALLLEETLTSKNFVWLHTCSMRAYREELLGSTSCVLGVNTAVSQRRHSHASLTVLWASLTINSRMLFVTLAKLFYEDTQPVEFFNLFQRAREDFLVSSDVAMRQQLDEFIDHSLITVQRKKDGNQYIEVTVDKKLLFAFLKDCGMQMDDRESDDESK